MTGQVAGAQSVVWDPCRPCNWSSTSLSKCSIPILWSLSSQQWLWGGVQSGCLLLNTLENIPQHIRFKISCIPDHCVTLGVLHNSAQWQYILLSLQHIYEILYVHTVWPENLVGNILWRIGGCEGNQPIFPNAKLFTVWCHHYRHVIMWHHQHGSAIIQT